MLLSYSGQCVIRDQTNYHTGSGDIIHIEGTVVAHQGGVDPAHDVMLYYVYCLTARNMYF